LAESKSLWSNYTWVCVNDDHELAFNDGQKESSNIRLLRKKLDENFPIGEQVMDPNKFRATYFRFKNVYFVTLDTVTERTAATEEAVTNGNKYLTILGDEQLACLNNMLSCIAALDGPSALIFIVVGKSMFGLQGGFPRDCVKEKDQIFEYIKKLRLKNVVFICGDSHFSDFTEFNAGGLTIREIRNSSITSVPRKAKDAENPHRYPGSLSDGVNNFGFVNVNGLVKEYTVTYINYTLNGEKFKYSWKLEK
jgi:alkaline phosphatase D